MNLLATAKNNAQWFRRKAEAKHHDVEHQMRMFRENEEAAEMWEATVKELEAKCEVDS